jgi:hypothetical protein
MTAVDQNLSFAPPTSCPIILWLGGDDAISLIGRSLERICYRGVYWTAEARMLDDMSFDLGPLTLGALPELDGSLFAVNLYTFGPSSKTYHASMTPQEAALTQAVREAVAAGERQLVLVDGPITDFVRSRLALEMEMASAVLDELIERAGLTGEL